MNCPKCNQPTEPGAAFCGNCGQALQAAPPPAVPASPIAQVWQNQSAAPVNAQPLNGPPLAAANTGGLAAGVPGYALARPERHSGENKALLALLFGVAGIAGALFMALIGLGLGVAGIVMGTMSRSSSKRGLSTAGLIVSSLAVLAGLAVWVYAVKHDPASQKTAPSQPTAHDISAAPVSASGLSTPCYSAGFVDKLNVANDSGSCDMNAFNGPTLGDSTNAYKVYAEQSSGATAANFASLSKPAIEQDIKDNLPGFSIDTERITQFAGSPAYIVNTSDKASGVAVVEAAVFHQVDNGQNVFILVHADNGRSTDLDTLEAQWQWN